MEQDNKFRNQNNGVYSKRVRAGRRRTYFFDVRVTRSNDYYLTITESKRRFDSDGYERHKLHLYKEDFNKFVDALQETVDHVKSELMPEYDFDEYTRRYEEEEGEGGYNSTNYTRNQEQPKEQLEEQKQEQEEEKTSHEDDLTWD